MSQEVKSKSWYEWSASPRQYSEGWWVMFCAVMWELLDLASRGTESQLHRELLTLLPPSFRYLIIQFTTRHHHHHHRTGGNCLTQELSCYGYLLEWHRLTLNYVRKGWLNLNKRGSRYLLLQRPVSLHVNHVITKPPAVPAWSQIFWSDRPHLNSWIISSWFASMQCFWGP